MFLNWMLNITVNDISERRRLAYDRATPLKTATGPFRQSSHDWTPVWHNEIRSQPSQEYCVLLELSCIPLVLQVCLVMQKYDATIQ